MIATVYKSTGSWYQVKTDDGVFHNARIKGKFKIDNISSTNPIAVGDFVEINVEDGEEKTAVIINILERKNYIVRSSPHNRNQRHIVASNLDQVLLFAGLKDPRTAMGFMDRFLVSAEAWHVPCMIIFNKCDLYGEKEWEIFDHIKEVYEPIGYKVFKLSLETKEGLIEIKKQLSDKTTLISGQSGVGKSTFINEILPHEQLKTQEVSSWSGKGQHTTTFAQMYDTKESGRIIDTPGIKEFGITDDISAQELSHYFPEMRELINECRFNNCLHFNEPGCAVKKAVEAGTINEERFFSYLNILESLPKKSY